MNEELVFNPTRLDVSRSVFPVKRFDKGSGFVGHLLALRPFEVLPGEGWDLGCSSLIRFTTPVHPVMDNLMCDVFAFYCSNEMLLKRQSFSPSLSDGNHSFAAIMGAQDGLINMPYPDNGLELPQLQYKTGKYDSSNTTSVNACRDFVCYMSLLDELGYPLVMDVVGTGAEMVFYSSMMLSPLPLLAYVSIWNENFREPNLQNRYSLTIYSNLVQLGSDYVCARIGANYGTYKAPLDFDVNHVCVYAEPFGVCRFHGLYGSLLPFPQRNSEPVFLPLGEMAPVKIGDVIDGSLKLGSLNNLKWASSYSNTGPASAGYLGIAPSEGTQIKISAAEIVSSGNPVPRNLWADLSQATSASINTIRVAFQTQKWFEALARGGNGDLDEYINSIFGVATREDVESKRPVYLGGSRFPISISQVNNTASDTGESGAFSLTTHDDHYVRYQSKTYGQIMFVFCIRHEDSFSDVPQKFLTKKSKFDFYAPQFANLGEESYQKSFVIPNVYNPSADDVLGYQEYAADYRYDNNHFGGQLRFPGDNSWHFASMFDSAGYSTFSLLSWLDASSQILDVDRCLKVPGSTARMQFYYDFYIYGKKYRPMPVNSIPGLVDHH